MITSTITFTLSTGITKQSISVEMNMDSPLWPAGMSDEENLEYWLAGAKVEPMTAMLSLGVDIEVTGELK
jgi:4'-phosphopantetheinyl transferase EntD